MEPAKLATLEKVIFLKSVDIFAHLKIEQLGRIAGLTTEVRFHPDETIVREGEPIDAVYLLLSGRVALEKGGQKTREIGEGNAFATVAALDFNPAVHTIKAVDHVHDLPEARHPLGCRRMLRGVGHDELSFVLRFDQVLQTLRCVSRFNSVFVVNDTDNDVAIARTEIGIDRVLEILFGSGRIVFC